MAQASTKWADQTYDKVKTAILARQRPDQFEMVGKILTEMHRYYYANSDLLQRYEIFNDKLKQNNIESFEALDATDSNLTETLIELSKKTNAAVLPENSFGLFGLTSTGKSTIVNCILGKEVAETGFGETTTRITPYQSTNSFIWDIPGKNDEVSYMIMPSISFWKGLTKRLIVIQTTIKENSSMMKLMDAIGLDYDIVVNKLDNVKSSEQDKFRQQIQKEIQTFGLKRVGQVFFISALKPNEYPDWQKLINYLQK